ncbi:MAG TPA: FkbM family methyltransferase [Croceibacterium sp.]|jgi:FkbM family methyltransferase
MGALRSRLTRSVRTGLALADQWGFIHRFVYDENLRRIGKVLRWEHRRRPPLQGIIAKVRTDDASLRFFVENDFDVVQSHHRAGTLFEAEELAVLARYYRGGTFVDVGGNVGNHAVWAARILRAPRVIVFEPDPHSARICEINLQLNGCGGVAELRRKGLSATAGGAAIDELVGDNLGGTRLREAAGGPMTLTRGDDELRSERVGVLKIDTEGFEMKVLEGLREIIARDRPTLYVEVENENLAAFDRFCARAGYRVAERFQPYPQVVDMIAVPNQA